MGPSTGGRPGDDAARRSVLEWLGRAEGPMGALEVSRGTHLSTLVVIPILGRLTDESLVRRERIATGSGRTDVTWAYELTGRGIRAAAASTAIRGTG